MAYKASDLTGCAPDQPPKVRCSWHQGPRWTKSPQALDLKATGARARRYKYKCIYGRDLRDIRVPADLEASCNVAQRAAASGKI